MNRRPRLIGLTGTNGAGKGVVLEYLKTRGYAGVSLSDVIREALAEEGVPPGRDAMIAKGNELRRRFGADVLARRVLARVSGPTAIDSIRNPAEVACLRRQEGFFLLAVDAPPALRFERVQARGRDESAATLEEFRLKENEEKSRSLEAQQIDACMALADAVVINNGSFEDLYRRLEDIL